MNRRIFLVTMLGVLLIAVVAVVAVFALGDDDDDPLTAAEGTIVRPSNPTATATLETAPDATATPVLPADVQARDLTLKEAPAGLLQFATDGPYVVPAEAQGVFYFDIASKQIEGWYELIEGTAPSDFSGDNRFTVFERKEQTLVGGVIYPGGTYLADRESRRVYRWDGDAQLVYEKTVPGGYEIASRGDLVLFRVPGDGDDWYALLNIETGDVQTTFQAEGSWALISRDASKLAIVGADVFIVDVAGGGVERIDQGALEGLVGADEMGRMSQIELLESRDGGSLIITKNNPMGADGGGAWLRYTWDGDLLAAGHGARVFPSQGGDIVAVVQGLGGGVKDWDVLTAVKTNDGAPAFRVVGVNEQFERLPEKRSSENRWLADGSGLVITLADHSQRIARRDGSFSDYVGAPSPESPQVFAINGGAVNAQGDTIAAVTFAGGIRDFVGRWGDTGEEVRILVPHLGYGGGPAPVTLIEPYVEPAPFDGEPALRLRPDAGNLGLLNLYDAPGGNFLAELGARDVTVLEVAMLCSGQGVGVSDQCPLGGSELHSEFFAALSESPMPNGPATGYWARISSGGVEGWLLLQVATQGF